MIKIGQIGIGHNHGHDKMLAVRKFPELFEVVGYAEENDQWIAKRGTQRGYDGLPRMRVEALIEQCDAVLIESDVWDLTKYAKMCVDAGKHIHMDKPASGTLEEYKQVLDIAQEKKKALNEAKDEISEMAMAIAGKVVGRSLDSQDQSRLVDQFIEELGEGL